MMSGEGVASVGTSAWLPTLAEMRDRVFGRLRDSERVFVTEAEVDQYLNEGYLDLNARLRLSETSVDGTADANGEITYPTDLVEPIALWFDETPAQFVDTDVFNSFALIGNTAPQQLATVFGGTISTYPVQDSEDYTLTYVSRPTMLTANSDQPTACTPELAMRLVWYAIAEAKWKEGEAVEAERFMQQYVEGLPGRPRMGHRMRPAPMTLIPEGGPFDA
jgi:hypothetical protein